MTHLLKSELIDLAFYEGFAVDYGDSSLGQWDALNNRFMVSHFTLWETYQVPMVYAEEEHEYFGWFFPYNLAQEQKHG